MSFIPDDLDPEDNGENEGIYVPTPSQLTDLIESGVFRVIESDGEQYVNLDDLVGMLMSQMQKNGQSNAYSAKITAVVVHEALNWIPFVLSYCNGKKELADAVSVPEEWQ
jgi:hypothetical protein